VIYFYLVNKPGMIIMGTQKTYNEENDNGYFPRTISWETVQGLMAEGWDIWADVDGKYIRFKNPNPCDL
jgi:hypothetical protein